MMIDDVVDEMEEKEEVVDQGTSLLTPQSSPKGQRGDILFRGSPAKQLQQSPNTRNGHPASLREDEFVDQNDLEQKIKEHFTQKLMSHDSIPARSAFLVNVSISAVVTKNPKWIKYQYDQEIYDKGLNQI
jgi:hypothetical protein